MPILSYFGVVGSVMVALLFATNLMLPKSNTPVVVTSTMVGLPKPWRPDPVKTLAVTPAPEPDMSSAAVLAATPNAAPTSVNAASEHMAQAEPAPKKKRVARRQSLPDNGRQDFAWSRNSDPAPFGGGGTFGRF